MHRDGLKGLLPYIRAVGAVVGSHGVVTDDWIAAHLRKIDRSNGEQQVKTLLQDFSRVPFVPFERPAQQAFMAAAALALCHFPSIENL